MSDQLRVILNPWSGSGAGERLLPRLQSALEGRGLPFRLECTERPGHAQELATRAGDEGAAVVLAAGGDGTIHEVANGLMASGGEPRLAVLPLGTGNDFHRMVGTDRSIDAALDLVQRGFPHGFEVGRVRWDGGEQFFINAVGVGVDTEVLLSRDRFRRLKGLAQYVAAVLSAVTRYRPIEVEVVLDGGERFVDRTMLAAVCVGPSAGGGFRLSPDARPDDGLLDLLFVDALSLPQVVRYLPKVIRGTHKNIPVVRMRTLRHLEIRSTDGEPFLFELDGELMPEATPALEIDVIPSALSVLRPVPAPS